MIYPPGICAVTAGEKWTQDDISYFLFMEKYMNRYPDFAPEIIGLHKKKLQRGKNYLPGSCQKEQSGFDSRSLFRYNYKAIQQLHSCIF